MIELRRERLGGMQQARKSISAFLNSSKYGTAVVWKVSSSRSAGWRTLELGQFAEGRANESLAAAAAWKVAAPLR